MLVSRVPIPVCIGTIAVSGSLAPASNPCNDLSKDAQCGKRHQVNPEL